MWGTSLTSLSSVITVTAFNENWSDEKILELTHIVNK